MGISDTVAIVTCSVCNVLEFLCFVVIIFEMSKHHVTHFRLFLSKVDVFSSRGACFRSYTVLYDFTN